MAQYDDLHTGTITFVGIVSAILTFVIIAAAQVLYYQYQSVEFQRKEVDVPMAMSDKILDGQRHVLNNYTWIDREKGIVSQPLNSAMSEVLKEMGAKSPLTPAETTP